MKILTSNLLLVVCYLFITSCSAKIDELQQLLSSSSISISNASASAVSSSSTVVNYQVTYTGASNITLKSSDILVQPTGNATCTKAVSITSLTQATVSFQNCMGDGTINFKIIAGTATNLTGSLMGASTNSASFTVDNSGVSSASFLALPGLYSEIPPSIDVTYSEMIDTSSISVSDFSINGSCSGVSISSVDTTGMVSTVNLTGQNGCAVGETVSLTVAFSGVADALGNLGSGSSVATYTVTDVGPTIGTYSPANTTITSGFNLFTLTLSGFIDNTTVDMNDFSLTGTCSGVSITDVSVINSEVTVQLSDVNLCTNGQTIVISTDLSGINNLSNLPGLGIVTTTYTLDTSPPNLTFSINTSTLAAIPNFVNITFSTDTDMNSITTSDFLTGGTCTSVSITNIVKSSNIVTVNLTGSELCNHAETVQLTVSLPDILDTAGNSGLSSELVEYTLDSEGPTATFNLNTSNVSTIPSSVFATFDSDTNMSSVSAADFSISGTCGVTLSSVTNTGAVSTLNLIGNSSCIHGQTVVITKNLSNVFDVLGNSGSGSQSITLTVDTVGPIATFSLSNSTLSALPTYIDIIMSTDTDMDTINSSHFIVSGTCNSTLNGITKSGNTIRLDLDGISGCTHTQTVMIIAAQGSMQDLTGNLGSGAAILQLTLDTVGPTVTLSSTSGHFNPLPTSYDAVFSADTDMSSVTIDDFSTSGTCPTGISSVNISGQVATVNLSGTLSCTQNQSVESSINTIGVSDLAGNLGLNNAVSATYIFDYIGPTISITPTSGSMSTMPSAITIIFDSDSDMSTVTTADFSIGGTCSVSLASLNKSGNVATLNLNGTGSCAIGSTLTITTILTTVQDQAGNSGVGSQLNTYTKL